jgi:hypothetical protein
VVIKNRNRRVSWRFITAVPITSKNRISYIKCGLLWRSRKKTAKPPDPRRSSGWELQQFQDIKELALIYNRETLLVKKKTASHRTRVGRF